MTKPKRGSRPAGNLGPRKARYGGARYRWPDPLLGHVWILPEVGAKRLSDALWLCCRCHQIARTWNLTEKIGLAWCQARHPALLTHNPERTP